MADFLTYLLEHDFVLIALIGVIAWLVWTGRGSKDRVDAIEARLDSHEADCNRRHAEIMSAIKDLYEKSNEINTRLSRIEGAHK